jgi:NADH-quinone oxidoreductase subunit H
MQTTFPEARVRLVGAVEIYRAIEGTCPIPLVSYLLWPLQLAIVRDLIAMLGLVGFICTAAAFGIWWERKVAGRIQSRLGPMRVGGWHGWAQSPADGLKLIFKEDFIPGRGDRLLFRLAPYLAFVPTVCAFVALPFATAWVFRDLDVALIFILAMLGVDVLGVLCAGLASNNKYSTYGGLREACQMVAYEIPMGMSLLVPVMMAGTMKLSAIADQQAGGFHAWLIFANPWCFAAFFIYYAASLAACKRAPFDLPEAESELVAGFLTEYSGYRWALFFFGEYAAMFAVSGLAVILFLGGWKSPLPASWAPEGTGFLQLLVRGLLFEGPILFILKAFFLFYVQLWVRWTLPRLRIDQVLYACVQVILPLAMVLLLGNTLWVLGIRHLRWEWLISIDAVLHGALVVVGYALVVAIFGLVVYGFVNRTRLVGRLAIRHLPGA